MKRFLLYSLLTYIFFASCSKTEDKTTNIGQNKVSVILDAKPFLKNVSLSNKNIETLICIFTDTTEDRNTVNYIKQQSGESNFGQLSSELPNGSYYVYIFAGYQYLKTGGKTVYYSKFVPSDIPEDEPPYPWSECFEDHFRIDVNNTPITKDVTLKRFTSELQIKTEDPLPLNLSTIYVTIRYEYDRYDYVNQLPTMGWERYQYSFSEQVPDSLKGRTNYIIKRAIANTITPVNIEISARDTSGKQITSVSLDNIRFERNKRTILSGRLFSSDSKDISLNDQWSTIPDTIIKY